MTDRNLVVIAAASAMIAALTATIARALPSDCEIALRDWDAHQAVLMDCREDPDCYITPADLERVRDLAPRVQACEGRDK